MVCERSGRVWNTMLLQALSLSGDRHSPKRDKSPLQAGRVIARFDMVQNLEPDKSEFREQKPEC